MGLREEKKHRTRVELIRAAIDLFREVGYETTTIDDIAARANYSRSTFFRHFGTKEDVVFGDTYERMAGIVESVRHLPADVNPWSALRDAHIRDAKSHQDDSPELAKECVSLWFSEPALRSRYTELAMQTEELVASYFAERWGVDPQTLECHIVAAAVIGVNRAAMQATAIDGADVGELLARGFDLYEQVIPSYTPARAAAPPAQRRRQRKAS